MRTSNCAAAIFIGCAFATVLLFSATPVVGADAPAKPMAAAERYVWDLGDLYPNVAAWDAERRRLLAELPKLEALSGTLGKDADSLRRGLDAISAVQRATARLAAYASLEADADQRISAAIERRELASNLAIDLGRSTSWLSNEILGIGAPMIEKYIAADPGLAKHAFFLRDTVRNAPHTLTPEGERIMAATSTLRGDAQSIYGLISNADIPWPTIRLTDGTDAKLTAAGYTRYRQADNRADRKAVFDAFWQVHRNYQHSLGATLFAEVKGNVFDAQMRKYPGALSASLAGNNLPESVYRTLVAETNAALPTLHRYLQLRKKLLGIPDDLRYYDLYPPMFTLKKTFTIEETKTITLAATAPLGREYTNTLREAVNARWMHVYPTEGKSPGAYMNGSAYGVHPYLLLNFNDDYLGLTTFAHEWGHGMHTILAGKAQPYETSQYPTFTAEIASITNEFLLNDYLVANAKSKDEKLFYLGEALENVRQTMFRQVMFAEFELRIHEAVEQGEALTGEKLTQMYCGLLKHYHGEDKGVMKIDDLYCSEWSNIPHFYLNFYVFQYATSMVAAAHFADEVGKGTPQRDTYLNMLRAGGSDYPYELLKKAGLDMAAAAPYRALFVRMDRIINQIEQLEGMPDKSPGK
jgi:oligoendopeptidase F